VRFASWPRDTNGADLAMGRSHWCSYDDERTTRDALVEVMSRGGFREQAFV
jgi:hypothetical protein